MKEKVKILKNESLSKYTFTKTGGPADFLAFPKSIDEVQELLQLANYENLPITVLGNASNLIIKDGGIRGLVIMLTDMNSIETTDNLVIADAGAAYIDVTIAAQKSSLSGAEFAAGIPGSVGGAIFMNAGAYGGETDQIADSIVALTPNNEIKIIKHDELDFGYRHSSIQDNNDIVLQATFKLTHANKNDIQLKMDHFNSLRSSKQPLELPSCGSVFKRPKGYFAGKLIHDSGLQGYQSGGAQVSIKHAGFIVNVGNASATDYLNVIHHVQKIVYDKQGVKLETEVRIIGEDK
ncbi:UDP-N-acetylmuramate dehydrogenase [Apilactobacillus micheneri]|uniref:UDP-N-acetylenolpyruvoylglucosamine reductase n=1 Tax=Apilactobacillus micheneri TaxID=1899430 RepID=A0A9Q8MTF9_9LACO|nr:UDP-N-acetylmuramate dehydrogenase [Apilactobacillus micheneri]TPR39229.1 UDP-N-acetylmuramate dehydrogenase [Apilactobacillus micheneri]TPR41345.1 UDP-N-acetylmuramate dehydrogenase [Apilactobacillus micheneri]TPR43203.1 UDP-N-acetylmuramate dehydrogenase [Apilactobacillus micheneri]TPR43987.1 UDP-N-acetylmuramate dehydrogenase [Apilactobacillus micheneri]TPR44451.1 UDP-N-acetylmuramate dehydrogenase [Apilactobacillus micheneri]